MAKDSAARIELGRSFHQGTFNLKVSESDFVPLWDGIKWRSLPERKLLDT